MQVSEFFGIGSGQARTNEVGVGLQQKVVGTQVPAPASAVSQGAP